MYELRRNLKNDVVMSVTNSMIHPTAIVDPMAVLGRDVRIGPYAVVEAGARLGDGCEVASFASIMGQTTLGSGCRVFQGAVVGTQPQDMKFAGEDSELIIGDRTTIREFCTLNRGTSNGNLKTIVGSDCLLMAYSHVAHDCVIGDHVILANGVNMAGHVTIGDYANLSGLTVVHQFVKIGCYAYLGGLSRVSQDVPPYALLSGNPVTYYGPNSIGLRRRGFSSDSIRIIKEAYQLIYSPKLNLMQAVEAVRSQLEQTEEIGVILGFLEHSERGLSGK